MSHRQTIRPGPLGLPHTYWVLWAGILLNRLGGAVFFLLGIYLTRERGLRPELAGLIIGLNAAGGLLAGPIGGVLADRIGRRPTLLVGTTVAGALMVALGLARSTVAIAAIAPALGFFTDLCRPPLQAAIADLVPPGDRARAYGLLYWAFNIGFTGAALIGGALAEHHFTLLFLVDAASTLSFGALVLGALPETRPDRAEGRVDPSVWRRVVGPLTDRRFSTLTLIQVPLLLAFVQVVVTLPLDMRSHGLGTGTIGGIFCLNGMLIIVVQPLAVRLLRDVSEFGALVRWLAVGAVLAGLGLGANALAAGTLGFAAATAIWTMGEICFSVVVPTAVANLAPPDARGVYQGTYQLAWSAAATVAPVLGSAVLAGPGRSALWAGCLVVCLTVAVLHLRFTARL